MELDDLKKMVEETLKEIKLEEQSLTQEEIERFLLTPKDVLKNVLNNIKEKENQLTWT